MATFAWQPKPGSSSGYIASPARGDRHGGTPPGGIVERGFRQRATPRAIGAGCGAGPLLGPGRALRRGQHRQKIAERTARAGNRAPGLCRQQSSPLGQDPRRSRRIAACRGRREVRANGGVCRGHLEPRSRLSQSAKAIERPRLPNGRLLPSPVLEMPGSVRLPLWHRFSAQGVAAARIGRTSAVTMGRQDVAGGIRRPGAVPLVVGHGLPVAPGGPRAIFSRRHLLARRRRDVRGLRGL